MLLGLREESADHGAADPFDLADVVDDQPSDALHQSYRCPGPPRWFGGAPGILLEGPEDGGVLLLAPFISVGTRTYVERGRRKLSNR